MSLKWDVNINTVLGGPTKSVIKAYLNNVNVGTKTLTGSGTTYTYTGLTPGTNYQFSVTPWDSEGAGIESNRLNVSTLAGNTPNQSYVYATYADFLSQCHRPAW